MVFMKTETVSLAELAARGIKPANGENQALVVVVDDEPGVADTIVAILEKSGFCAIASYRAETALELVTVVPPDLMIIDIGLPGINGLELAMIIEKEYPNCRVLLLTADPDTEEMVAKARRQGHEFPVLMKPMYPGDLLSALAGPEGAWWRKHTN